MYVTRCQISRSKYYLYSLLTKVFFNTAKNLFKSFESLIRSGKVQMGSKAKGNFVLGGPR